MIDAAPPPRSFPSPRENRVAPRLRAASPGCYGIGAGLPFLAMRYLSTRDAGPVPAARSFEEALLAGLAEDGGLYVPERLPALDHEALRDLAGLPYAEVASRVVGLFAAGSFTSSELR